MTAIEHDIRLLSDALKPIEQDAKGLHWAKERPWKCSSHLWPENGIPVIDLHDLNAKLTKRIIGCVRSETDALQTGGVVFVTGVGRHSVGLPVLRQVVQGSLLRLERDEGWRQRDGGGGRILLVMDEARIPSFWRAQTPWLATLFFVVFFAALLWSLNAPHELIIALAVGVVLWGIMRGIKKE